MGDEDHVAAARAVYDASAPQYVELVGSDISPVTETPIDRALLRAFGDMLSPRTGARVADVGCGPGRAGAAIADHGLDVVGIDVSPAMLAAARRAHPHIAFVEGRIDRLPIGDGRLAGVVSWYSIIHTPPDRLDGVFTELRRVLDVDGLVLLAFQSGRDQAERREQAYGTGLTLTSYRHELDHVARQLTSAGFGVRATTQRARELAHESTPQAFVMARRA